jgi:hypothetical protein
MIPESERRRLHSHAERVRTITAELTAERSRRNGIIRELVDVQGHPYRAVARAAGLSVAQVGVILSSRDA